jgi:transposase-like protein DUF772
MLLFTISFGGLLMMGHQARGESLFYYFRLEDQVPENHLLRLIERHVDFEFIRAKLKDLYSDAGRPSIDPELLLRMLLVGYLYGVTSERKLVEELRMHLAWRWFNGLGFDQEIPLHSTNSLKKCWWHAASNNPTTTLLNKHAISVGVEAVSLGNAVVVSPEDVFLSRQGADQHQECRLGQVEVGK